MEELRKTPFRESWVTLRNELKEISHMMDDPFKPPEETIAVIPKLIHALWIFQVEWIVLNRGPLTDDFALSILKEARRNVGLATNDGMAEAGRILDALIVRTERGEDRVL